MYLQQFHCHQNLMRLLWTKILVEQLRVVKTYNKLITNFTEYQFLIMAFSLSIIGLRTAEGRCYKTLFKTPTFWNLYFYIMYGIVFPIWSFLIVLQVPLQLKSRTNQNELHLNRNSAQVLTNESTLSHMTKPHIPRSQNSGNVWQPGWKICTKFYYWTRNMNMLWIKFVLLVCSLYLIVIIFIQQYATYAMLSSFLLFQVPR